MRPNWDNYFLKLAETVALRATCPRASVGAVLVKNRQVLATGYNGSIRDTEHCTTVGCLIEHNHCKRTIHAEMNALTQAAKHGMSIEDAICYSTHDPCWECFRVLVNAGISSFIFREIYGELDGRVKETSRQLEIERRWVPK